MPVKQTGLLAEAFQLYTQGLLEAFPAISGKDAVPGALWEVNLGAGLQLLDTYTGISGIITGAH